MQPLSPPSKCDVVIQQPDHATVTVEPLYPGYGTTVGNALRRVLLSSLPGAAATAVKITGVSHEFSAVPHIKEDVVAILLNLKQLRFRLEGEDALVASLKVKGERVVTGKDLALPTNLSLLNPEQPIATITDKAGEFELELSVGPGRGYVPVENREKEKLDIGTIALDAIYTPVRNVNFEVEHVRVEQMTNYDRLILDVRTDGTLSPVEAVVQAGQLLVEHFQFVTERVASANPTPAETVKPVKRRSKKAADAAESPEA